MTVAQATINYENKLWLVLYGLCGYMAGRSLSFIEGSVLK